MDIAALITWIVTATGGSILLGTWLRKGGAGRHMQPGRSRFPPPLIFGHMGLASVGLIVWISYLLSDRHSLAWTAFALLVPVAALGFTMLRRWVPTYRARHASPLGAVARTVGRTRAGTAGRTAAVPRHLAESHFPVPVVGAHGMFAVVTVVLVFLTALRVGGN